jgi:hypothetical protein
MAALLYMQFSATSFTLLEATGQRWKLPISTQTVQKSTWSKQEVTAMHIRTLFLSMAPAAMRLMLLCQSLASVLISGWCCFR